MIMIPSASWIGIHVYPTEQDRKFFFLWEAQFVLLSLYFMSTDDYVVETEYTGKSVFFLF